MKTFQELRKSRASIINITFVLINLRLLMITNTSLYTLSWQMRDGRRGDKMSDPAVLMNKPHESALLSSS